MSRRWLLLLGFLLMGLMGGCSTLSTPNANLNPADPWENWNRKVFSFNDTLDRAVTKPVATGYAKVMPQFVRTGVGNFFGNFGDAWSAVNNILQGKGEPAFQDVVRFTTNSVFGFLGVLDIASEFGLKHHNEDFGQTLGVWGVGPGPYFLLPVLGPSTVRDTFAKPADMYFSSPTILMTGTAIKASATTLNLIETRAGFLGASKLLDETALDKYSFVRDAYLQRRRNQVYDGNPPDEPESKAEEPAPDTPSNVSLPASAPR
jgi:phospholipid-binding lipoprotein MlaA